MTALITGASKGIGKELVIEFAKNNIDVILVARSQKLLHDLAQFVKDQYGINTYVFDIDLSEQNAAEELYHAVNKKELTVHYLVNNAGFGGVGSFEDYSIEYIEKMIDLNIKATTNLTHYFIPDLKNNSPSYILNNASMIANFPCPYKSIYAASKVYVKYFTEALRVELKAHGISVSLLQPGATPTNDVVKNQINNGGFFARISVTKVSEVAIKAIRDTLNGKPIIIPGWKNRMSLRALKIVPKSVLRFLILRSAKSILNS